MRCGTTDGGPASWQRSPNTTPRPVGASWYSGSAGSQWMRWACRGSMSETAAGRSVWPGDSGPGGRGDDVAREAVLARAFVRLADTLASDFDIVDFLHGLAEDSVEILRAAAAGVMLADARGRLRLIASSDERMRLLELRVRTDVIGALNLFRGSDEPFTAAEMEIAKAMAEMATIGLIQERALRERNLLAAQLQAALNSRVIIEQAKGMIAEYRTVTVDDAFKLLRNYAHYHNRKLSEVASDVVDRRIPSAALGRPHGEQS